MMGGTIGVGTPHTIERKSLIFRFPTDAVGGWVVPTAEYSHLVAPSCKLELARFQNGAECGNKVNLNLCGNEGDKWWWVVVVVVNLNCYFVKTPFGYFWLLMVY